YSGLEDWRAATRALSQGLALSPRNPALLEQLGKAAAQLGDWTGAERSLRAVLQITPRALEPRLALARVYLQSGNRARALQELEVAMRFYPDKDELREAHEATRTAPLPSGTPQRSDGTGKMP
ncbi:MAG: tetratricopeptide repeat protein, partial [candidate division NC10 bacterium]